MAPELIDSLDDELKPMVLAIVAQNASLLGRIDELLGVIGKLNARIAELEAKLGVPPKTPDNSSLPPSSAKKANGTDAPAEKKRRKGRPGVARALAENPDATRNIYAKLCGCGTQLMQADQQLAHAYDHIEIPPIKPITTRINLHRGQCPCCKKTTTAKAPADMPTGSPFGPNIVALVTYFHTSHMISYARMIEMLGGVFGLKLSEGAIANMLSRSAKPFAASSAAIAAIVRASPVIASDETSARVCKKTYWQWVFAAKAAVLHMIASSRKKIVATEFLAGAKPDVWISDRLPAQATHASAQQVCLAHLIRDAQCQRRRCGRRDFRPAIPDVSEARLRRRTPPAKVERGQDRGLRARPASRTRSSARTRTDADGRQSSARDHAGRLSRQVVGVHDAA